MAASRALLYRGMRLVGKSGTTFKLIKSCTIRRDGSPSSTWLAFNISKPRQHFIIKQPFSLRNHHRRLFANEVELLKKVEDSWLIRPIADHIPRVLNHDDTGLQRTLTRKEIKFIMKVTLLALCRLEEEGVVNTDLHMDNILLHKHDRSEPKDHPDGSRPDLIVKLADLSHALPPQQLFCQPIQYRAPEAHFKQPWSYPAHVWSWGVMLVHLLEARANIENRGIYEEFIGKHGPDQDALYGAQLIHDFSLSTVPFYVNVGIKVNSALMFMLRWNERLRGIGLRLDGLFFLEWALDPNPATRPTLSQIYGSGWLDDHPNDGDSLEIVRTEDYPNEKLSKYVDEIEKDEKHGE